MKKFFTEFKKFITRGNVMDLAVGVIIGGAFTAIVNALSNNILRPIINWIIAGICGTSDLSNIYTFLKKTPMLDESGNPTGALDLTKSIYIDWGAFLSAVLNFLIIAFVLFIIVKTINKLNEGVNEFVNGNGVFTKSEIRKLRREGKTTKQIRALEQEKLAADKAAEEQRKAEEAKNAPPTQEQLLTLILEELKSRNGGVKE